MRTDDYEVIDPQGSEAGDQLKRLVHEHPFATERLVRALEEFVRTDTDLSSRIVERADIEIYLVPQRYVLRHLPDLAAVVRVDHANTQIDIVTIIDVYGGQDEPAQWQAVQEIALAAATAA
jgi:hypothetical protein